MLFIESYRFPLCLQLVHIADALFSRKFIFITGGLPSTYWRDYFDYDKRYGIQICNSEQFVGDPKNPDFKSLDGVI